MPELITTEERLKAAIHFRTIDEPCCGNCKWFNRMWEDTECQNRDNYEVYGPDEDDCNPAIFPDEHNVCDRFERKKKGE